MFKDRLCVILENQAYFLEFLMLSALLFPVSRSCEQGGLDSVSMAPCGKAEEMDLLLLFVGVCVKVRVLQCCPLWFHPNTPSFEGKRL